MGKYEEALEMARAGKPIDEVFPELKMSEDERIRKGIIHYILYEAGNILDKETEHKFISWLEKQKEPEPAELSGDVYKVVLIVYKFIRKVLDGFGVYSEEEELIDSREALLCHFGQDCAEEIIKSLRPQPQGTYKKM